MLDLKFVPAANWALMPFQGPQIVLIDEQSRLGFWGGSAYALGGGFTAASQAEAEAGTENSKGMTPLRVAQAFAARANVAAASATYNADGSLATMTEAGVTYTYTYNADGSVNTISNGTTTVTASYNADGSLAAFA